MKVGGCGNEARWGDAVHSLANMKALLIKVETIWSWRKYLVHLANMPST